MKRQLALTFPIIFLSAVALAADVKVTMKVATGLKDTSITTFSTDTPKIFAIFDTEGIGEGDKVRGVLVAEDVGDAAAADTKVVEKTLTLDEDAVNGEFNFAKPTQGWPPGKYRIEIYVNDELAAKTRFRVQGAQTGQSAADQSSTEVPDKDQLKSMTEASLVSFGRAVKKEDFSAFYADTAGIWQKQTTPEKLRDAFKDFFNKDIDLPAAIEGKEPVFNRPPSIDADGVLIVRGYYPTTPNRTVFQLKYLKDDGDWKLVGVNVNLKE
jgi:hypothetical protein